jgi:hypothetical protein
LESVLKNDYPNYQVIVVDNNSPNNSMEYIRAWAEGKLDVWVNPNNPLRKLSFPPVKKPVPYIFYTREEAEKGGNPEKEEKLKCKIPKDITTQYPLIFIQSGENLGFAGGNNVGIRYALAKDDFEYIWLLNNDTVIDKNSLTEMVKVIQKDEKIGMVGSKLLRYDKPNILQTLCGTSEITWFNAGRAKYIHPNEKDTTEFDKEFKINNGYIVGASMLIKKQVFKDIGLFDENFFMWAEETDLCIRTFRKGWELYCAGRSIVWHKEGASTDNGNEKQFLNRKSVRPTLQRFIITGYLDIRNHIYLVNKHWGKFYTLLYLIGPNTLHLIRRIIGIILYDDNKIEKLKILIKGLIDGINKNMGIPKEFKK